MNVNVTISNFTTPEEGPGAFVVPIETQRPFILPENNSDNNIEYYHSTSYPDTFSPNIDIIIASAAILLSVTGVLGNILSALYFRQGQRKSLHYSFYSIITVCDALTSAAAFPVIASLLSSRSPLLFEHSFVCITWPVFYYLVFRVSMLIVVLLSVTRTISIVYPMKHIKHYANKMLWGVLGYAALLLTIDIVFVSVKWAEDRYYKYLSLCELAAIKSESEEYSTSARLYSILLQAELILPCLLVFASFLTSTVFLMKRKATQYTHINSKNEKKFRRVSITIALFTALFLVCYLPCFLLQALYFVTMFRPVPGILENSSFPYYGHLVAQFLLPLLNSAVNPCLYVLRMSQFVKWLKVVAEDPSRIIVRNKYVNMNSSSLRMGSNVSKMGSSRGRVSLGSHNTLSRNNIEVKSTL